MAKFNGDYSDIVHLRVVRRHAKQWLSGYDSAKSDINEQAVATILELFFLEGIKFDIEKKADKLYGKFNALFGNESALSALTEKQKSSATQSALALMNLELGVNQQDLVEQYLPSSPKEGQDISALKRWIFNNQKHSFSELDGLKKDAWIREARKLLYYKPYSNVFIKHIQDKHMNEAIETAKRFGFEGKEYYEQFPSVLKFVIHQNYHDKPKILSLFSN
ncbi:hypothetical protein [Vibrio fluvialis]|uniref:hypothetical protein n=1 Tax=Vibrio fluvialis TaxID=676 RepID=UPI0014045D20|nr:hypothetical protein [Vibrio fluvialis]NHN73798.1 hypothetical protein [Vibrio fluvialis]